MITLSSNVQSERRDCIVFCPDLLIGIRANGEETTALLDLAGNKYPAGIPAPETVPTLALGAAAANRLIDGYYAYGYVYAAKNRYPLLDAGRAHAGSIAPRSNPSPLDIIQVTGGPRRVVVTVFGSERLDIDQIILYRTNVWATLEQAELARDAGQLFAIALLDNTLPNQNYNDDNPLVSNTEILEFDNHMAPTVQYLAYEAPFMYAIGNDPLIKFVNWAGNTISLDDEGKWFEGRNGQLCTVTGITSGGIDGRGTFLFKAGDAAGNNINNSAVLTIDGTTPEVLSPSTGSGYIRIAGPATTLFRSKPFNPLSWGETVFQGTQRFAQLFARRISGGRATGIAIVPGGEYLKIDVKDPSKCYVFSLRAAGTPAFEASRRVISEISISFFFSQFVATSQDGRKVLWGWDADNHAIVECDGTSQRAVSSPILNLLRDMQTETTRAQYVQGICNEELEYNIIFMPWGEDIHANDLAIFQHYPSGKWSTALVGDLLSICVIRDPLTNLLRHLAGRDSGILVEHQREDLFINSFSGIYDIISFVDADGTIIANTGLTPEFAGRWCVWYSNEDHRIKFGQLITINIDSVTGDSILNFDKVHTTNDGSQIYTDTVSLNGEAKLMIGQIPTLIEKILELGTPSVLKEVQSISISGLLTSVDLGAGANYGVARLYVYTPDMTQVERYPQHELDPHFDTVTSNQGNYVFEKIAAKMHGKLSMQFSVLFFDEFQIRTLNFDIR